MPSTVEDLYTKLESLTSKASSVDDKLLEKVSHPLEKFLASNDKTFHFTSTKTKDLINLLIRNLKWMVPERNEPFSRSILQCTYNHLQVLRILSRDPSVVKMMDKDNHRYLLLFTSFSQKVENAENLDKSSLTVYQDIDAEALKLFCNFSYHNSEVRKYLISQQYSRTLLGLVQKRVESRLFLESDVFLMRLLFLLSALEIQERQVIRRDYQGVSILSYALTTVVQNSENCPENAEANNAANQAVLPAFETKLACEILKALFNITVGISDAKVVDVSIVEQCSSLLKELFHLFTHYKLDYLESDNVFTHSANLLLNMPKDSFETFIPKIEEDVSEEKPPPFEGEEKEDPTKDNIVKFQGYDMSAIACLLEGLGARLSSELNMAKPELLPSLLSCLSYMCRLCKPIRKFVRFSVLPPLKDASKRPEESNDMRGKLVQLMTDIDRNIKYLAADFLFVLCKENVDRLVKHTGYGNAAGFLASRGLMLGRNNEFTGDYSSSEDDSDTEEYRHIEDKIDPITGAIRSETENPLQGMTEEEKELEAEKLVNLIGQLSDMKVIQPMKVGEDGRPVELRENEIKDIMRKKLDDHKS